MLQSHHRCCYSAVNPIPVAHRAAPLAGGDNAANNGPRGGKMGQAMYAATPQKLPRYCVPSPDGSRVCGERCGRDSDCPDGWICAPLRIPALTPCLSASPIEKPNACPALKTATVSTRRCIQIEPISDVPKTAPWWIVPRATNAPMSTSMVKWSPLFAR